MYLDLIVLAIFIVFVVVYSKRFQTYMFGFGMIDIIFRILNLICGFIPSKEIRGLINTYIPESVPGVISKYTTGMFNTVLIFIYVVLMAIFLYFVIKIFIKRKKI